MIWVHDMCFFGAPSQPFRSMSRLSKSWPMSKAIINTLTPINGMSQALPYTMMAPSIPPIQIHHGALVVNAFFILIMLPLMQQKTIITTVAMANSTVVAWIAEPITCPSDARIAPTTAERHPESTAASCHSTFRKPPLSTLLLFLSRGMMTTIVTPTISSTAPIARCQPSGITLAPNHPKWSMHKLNISWLNMGITIACSWPNSLKRCMAMVIVISGIMPMNQLHHGAS